MKKCPYKDQIDDYLLNRLIGDDKDRFEEHYFNCFDCFAEMEERDALIRAVKHQGPRLIADLSLAESSRRLSWIQKLLAYFSFRPWATAAVSAILVLAVTLGVAPLFKKQATPRFFLNQDGMVRGESLSLISPVIDVKSAPMYFEWKKLGEDVQYKIYMYQQTLLWNTTTRETRIAVPDEVRKRMIPGETYSWEVMAFSSKGTLIAVSSRVQFKIGSTE